MLAFQRTDLHSVSLVKAINVGVLSFQALRAYSLWLMLASLTLRCFCPSPSLCMAEPRRLQLPDCAVITTAPQASPNKMQVAAGITALLQVFHAITVTAPLTAILPCAFGCHHCKKQHLAHSGANKIVFTAQAAVSMM